MPVKLFGHQFKTWQVWAVGIGGAGVSYFVWRQHQAAAAAAASASNADTTTDPITGMTDAQDIAEYGSVAAADAAYQSGAGYDTSGYGSLSGYGTTYGPVGSLDTTLGYTSGSGYASNSDWDQAATSGLTSIGYSETDVASALGRYLAGLSLTPDQQNIVQVALAEYGNPPGGAPPIVAAPATGTATSGDTTTTTAAGTTTTGTASSSTGSSSSASTATSTVSGGHVVSVNNNEAVVAWSHSGPAAQWHLVITGPGAINGHTATVGIPQGSYSGLEAGHTYDVQVTPWANGKAAGPSGVITFKTT